MKRFVFIAMMICFSHSAFAGEQYYFMQPWEYLSHYDNEPQILVSLSDSEPAPSTSLQIAFPEIPEGIGSAILSTLGNLATWGAGFASLGAFTFFRDDLVTGALTGSAYIHVVLGAQLQLVTLVGPGIIPIYGLMTMLGFPVPLMTYKLSARQNFFRLIASSAVSGVCCGAVYGVMKYITSLIYALYHSNNPSSIDGPRVEEVDDEEASPPSSSSSSSQEENSNEERMRRVRGDTETAAQDSIQYLNLLLNRKKK